MQAREPTRLRAVRRALGVSQSDLSRRVGIHQSLISRVERCLIPTWPRLRRAAAEALAVTEDVLFLELHDIR